MFIYLWAIKPERLEIAIASFAALGIRGFNVSYSPRTSHIASMTRNRVQERKPWAQ